MTATEAPSHPAKWSAPVLEAISEAVARYPREEIGGPAVLDPFAGVGLAKLQEALPGSIVYGVEIEPEWAAVSGATVGSALALPWGGSTFDILCTSPCYGNRMADDHEARDDSARITYRHKLGRPLTEGSAGGLQWGNDYRAMHQHAWHEALRVLRGNALVIINVSNHLRAGIEQRVVEWHLTAWLQLGATVEEVIKIPTRRMGYGQNGQARVDGERLLVLRAPAKPRGSML